VNESAEESSNIPKWTVWRQDGNGNRYIVEHHTQRAVAETQAAEMEARGHKQLYWVEPYGRA
jgi:hypothetical protein